jgi:hypothetical protein
LWKSDQYASVTPNLHSFLETFVHIWSNWDPVFVVLSLNCDFNWNLFVKYNNSYFFLVFSFKMLTLKSPIMMIGQCSWDYWIIVWRLFKNVEIEHEWTLYTHTIYIAFRVLILKVAIIYFEPSLVIVLKESKCMCMSYITINPWPSWIEIYEYFNEFINLCICWCIMYFCFYKT